MKKNLTEKNGDEKGYFVSAQVKGNNEYKSDLFSLLMQVKEYALEIYNAVNNSDYKDPEAIRIITLEHGVSLSIRNDASFILDMCANYYEHQSTYNPNMPLRSLIYFVEDIKNSLDHSDQNIYGGSRVYIPTPHFVVFYNGEKHRPEMEIQKLSESFYKKEDEKELELTCKVININPGNNVDMMKKTRVLSGYTKLVEMVRNNQRLGMELRDAIHRAVDDCIQMDVLADFLKENRSEVEKTMNLDYTFQRQLELTAKAEYKAGVQEGIRQEKVKTDAAEERANAAEERANAVEKRAAELEAEIARLQKLLSQNNE